MASPGRRAGVAPKPPREIPALLVRKGEVYRPGPEGPEPVRSSTGAPLDAFDAFDRLTPGSRRIYVADLDGIEHGEPQLDLWQELSRDADLWIDGGVQTADQAIDILVAGARRAVLSTGRLRGPDELRKAWGLSQELAVEMEIVDGRARSKVPEWSDQSPATLAASLRAIGPTILVVSPRGQDVDWSVIRSVSAGGSTYVAGSYQKGSVERLVAAGARGGIYYAESSELLGPAPSDAAIGGPLPSPRSAPSPDPT